MLKALTLAACVLINVQAAPAEDEFTILPNMTAMSTKSYSGYLPVTDSKALHYIFVESKNQPTTDPVVIWFNGGPGCSSLLAFFQENGPWVVGADGNNTIYENPYPWNNNASMLWIESPAGVGYSIANNTADKSTNDMVQSQDAIVALQAWYNKFPEFWDNPLFVSGESYAGIYVPYLTWQIYQYNMKANMTGQKSMNIKGFMVGNGATNWDFDVSPSFPETIWNFNLIPKKYIDFFNANNCTYYFNDFRNHTGPASCDPVWDAMQNLTSALNWYDLYRTTEAPITAEERIGKTMVAGQEKTYKRGMSQKEYTPWAKFANDRVANDFLSDYVNNETVREALHIPSYAPGWDMCWGSQFTYNLQNEASMWIYPILKGAGYKLMFYSGDTDGAVPTYGTKRWLQELNWPVKKAWRPWLTQGQVSGYIEQYDGLDFVTVKGVGHMAPQWARQPVTDMITAWIHGQDF